MKFFREFIKTVTRKNKHRVLRYKPTQRSVSVVLEAMLMELEELDERIKKLEKK